MGLPARAPGSGLSADQPYPSGPDKPAEFTSGTEIGARLVLTRTALDYTQATMAGLMGVDGQTFGRLLSRPAAHPDEAGAQALPLRHPARLDLPGADGQPTPAHPRQEFWSRRPNPRTRAWGLA